MKQILIIILLFITSAFSLTNYRYAVIISSSAYNDAQWKLVADTFLDKHRNVTYTLVCRI